MTAIIGNWYNQMDSISFIVDFLWFLSIRYQKRSASIIYYSTNYLTERTFRSTIPISWPQNPGFFTAKRTQIWRRLNQTTIWSFHKLWSLHYSKVVTKKIADQIRFHSLRMTLHATDKLGQGKMIFLYVDLSANFRTEIRLPPVTARKLSCRECYIFQTTHSGIVRRKMKWICRFHLQYIFLRRFIT